LPQYVARRVLPAPVEDVWAVLADPDRFADWWPGIRAVEPTVRRALAPGALWRVEGGRPGRAGFRRQPAVGGNLLVLDVVPQRTLAFQLMSERIDVDLDLAPHDDGTEASLTVEAPRFSGIRREFPSQALARLAAVVRSPAE
jgi:uncharacterized protein YndB with AHSA1/START domain